ncbi:MAG: S9 family peptidase [Deltaproteobacteria bacterium]|nr:S9 family peptidase [Deltaproteobacteria bacterium]
MTTLKHPFPAAGRLLACALSFLLPAAAAAAPEPAKKGLTVEDMLAMQRVSGPVVSPDGKRVAFTVRDTDVAANRGRTDVWITHVDGTGARRLTTHPENDTDPRFSADGNTLFFLSTRGGSSQVWRISVGGGEAEAVTELPLDVNAFRLFPDGKRLLIAVDVYPDAATLADTRKRDQAREESKVKALVFDELLFRHWDTWEDGKRSHLWVVDVEKKGEPLDLMKGMNVDCPTHPFGGVEDMIISPDGKTVVFAAKDVGTRAAWSTNVDLFSVPADGKARPVKLTAANEAWDGMPAFSPDGKTLGYLAMARPGYESDQTRIVLLDLATGKRRVLADGWDRSPDSVVFSADGATVFTAADNLGSRALFALDVAKGTPRILHGRGTNGDAQLAGDRVVFVHDRLDAPGELYSIKADGTDVRAVTRLNEARVNAIAWGESEQFTFKGAHGDTVHGWAVKPANYKPGTKAPVAMIIHGGPQGSMGDHFHYRWNPQAFAGRGYGVVFIDFHGSTGYGQAFTDAIRGDWGGAPYEDLMKGLDAALAKYPWLDGTRTTALGASFGGYMINWINGHTDRFKALVVHDGNIDERMAYFDTEELWFPEWEHGGPPWEAADGYMKHNPVDLVKNWKTPTLVVHGARDFRVVDTQGMGTFTALQRRGVPSRMLWFPDENHWVLKPQNSRKWHEEVLGWLDRYTKK